MTVSVTAIIFRLVNFGIIVAVGVYAYRRYGKELLQEWYREDEAKKRALHDEVLLLSQENKALDDAFAKKQELAQRLSQHIDQWRASVAHAQAMREQEKRAITSLLQQKAERIARYTAWLSLRRECLDDALQEATQSLTVFYAREDAAHTYLAKIVSQLKERA